MTNDYINIGKLVAVHGLNGEMILKHALAKKTSFKQGDVLFIEKNKGSYLPYFIKESKAKNDEETIVLFEEITTREKAKLLLQKPVWLTQEMFRKMAGKNAPIALIGYTLINEEETVGIIEAVIEQPHQVLLTISVNNKEALVPLHEETLDSIDHKKKEVHVTLPDGLLDIYLEA